ncbi:MAG: hypothetical protein ABWY64_12260 [Tardiphaga sp.]
MSYALFANDVKVSRAFPTKSDVWQHAADSGLVMEVGSREEDPPRRVLDMGYAIHECQPDLSEASKAPGMSEYEISQLIATCTANPRSAAVAS